MNNDISKIAMTAMLIEGIITYLNDFLVLGVTPWQIIVSLVLGVTIAVAYNFDLLKHFGMQSNIPYIGCVLTGILVSRGSNYVYDLIGKLSNF